MRIENSSPDTVSPDNKQKQIDNKIFLTWFWWIFPWNHCDFHCRRIIDAGCRLCTRYSVHTNAARLLRRYIAAWYKATTYGDDDGTATGSCQTGGHVHLVCASGVHLVPNWYALVGTEILPGSTRSADFAVCQLLARINLRGVQTAISA